MGAYYGQDSKRSKSQLPLLRWRRKSRVLRRGTAPSTRKPPSTRAGGQPRPHPGRNQLATSQPADRVPVTRFHPLWCSSSASKAESAPTDCGKLLKSCFVCVCARLVTQSCPTLCYDLCLKKFSRYSVCSGAARSIRSVERTSRI